MTPNMDNEQQKRDYVQYLKGAKGFAESTVRAHERAIGLWEEFTQEEDFKHYSQKRAQGFLEWLRSDNDAPTKPKLVTLYHNLRFLRAFFEWLASRKGYKHITAEQIAYLRLRRKEVEIALTPGPRDIPSPEDVIRLVDSIKAETEAGRRDRVLAAALLLAGMRVESLISLSLQCFDPQTLTVHLRPEYGVRTKRSKAIDTVLVVFDEGLLAVFLDWFNYLSAVKRRPSSAPLFRRTKPSTLEDSAEAQCCEVEPLFWRETQPVRDMLERRSAACGLHYFSPHDYRHAHVIYGLGLGRSGKEWKALSQNIGHSNLATTLQVYARLDDHQVKQALREINARPKTDPLDDPEIRNLFATLAGKVATKRSSTHAPAGNGISSQRDSNESPQQHK